MGVMFHIYEYVMHDMMHECDVVGDSSLDDIFF